MVRVSPEDLARWRKVLYAGDNITAHDVRRLIAEVETLKSELVAARPGFARKAAAALEKRLKDVAAFNHGGCRTCRDAEARAFLAKLKTVAGEQKAP